VVTGFLQYIRSCIGGTEYPLGSFIARWRYRVIPEYSALLLTVHGVEDALGSRVDPVLVAVVQIGLNAAKLEALTGR
jgi:hypothetical protein